jgi:hypothetical protein
MTDPTGGHNPSYRQEEPQSTPEAAKQEAAGVARAAAERGAQVGDTAGEQARRVASETARQARDLVREGRGQLVEQAKEGQRKAASSLHTLADQLRDMAEKNEGDGLVPEVVHQAAERTRGVATWLDEREPGALLDEVRAFARRRPGVFLAGAAFAGVLVGRLTRGAVAGNDSSGDSTPESPARPAATPVPAAPPVPAAAPGQPVGGPTAPGYSVPPPPQPATWTGTPGEYSGPVTR